MGFARVDDRRARTRAVRDAVAQSRMDGCRRALFRRCTCFDSHQAGGEAGRFRSSSPCCSRRSFSAGLLLMRRATELSLKRSARDMLWRSQNLRRGNHRTSPARNSVSVVASAGGKVFAWPLIIQSFSTSISVTSTTRLASTPRLATVSETTHSTRNSPASFCQAWSCRAGRLSAPYYRCFFSQQWWLRRQRTRGL